MRIEFLFWEECPSHEEALRRLREVLSEEGVADPVQVIRIASEEEARRLSFPGSPTIRLDGVDIQPELVAKLPVGLTCRAYRVGERISPLPTKEMIRSAVRRAKGATENRG